MSSSPLFGHEKLAVFQRSITFTKEIYRLTRNLPADERFGSTGQFRPAAASIGHNIAEGNGRLHPEDRCRFLEVAYESPLETVAQLTLAVQLEFLSREQTESVRSEAEEIARTISGLRKRYLQDATVDSPRT